MFGRNTGKPLKGPTMGAHTIYCLNFQNIILFQTFTGRNEVVAKVMFLLVSVILSTGEGGVCLSACWDTTPLPSRPRLPRRSPRREADSGIRSMSGRYASYWNAFLF